MFRGLSLKWTEGFQGEEEIRDINTSHLFQSPVILFDGLVSRGEGGRKLSDQVRKIYQVQVLVILWP